MKRTILLSLAILVLLTLASSPASAAYQKVTQLKPALVVIDIQNEYIPLMSQADVKAGLPAINEWINLFRSTGLPIIRVYHTDPDFGPKQGTKGFEFPETTTIKPDDPMIVKNYPSAFKKTDLDKILKEKGINTLFLCGLSATGCVLATYHGALDLDYDVFMVDGALIGPDSDQTKFVLKICGTVNGDALFKLVKCAVYEEAMAAKAKAAK